MRPASITALAVRRCAAALVIAALSGGPQLAVATSRARGHVCLCARHGQGVTCECASCKAAGLHGDGEGHHGHHGAAPPSASASGGAAQPTCHRAGHTPAQAHRAHGNPPAGCASIAGLCGPPAASATLACAVEIALPSPPSVLRLPAPLTWIAAAEGLPPPSTPQLPEVPPPRV